MSRRGGPLEAIMPQRQKAFLELADDLLDAVQCILSYLRGLEEPLEHYWGSLAETRASILDALSGVLAQLSLIK